MGLQSVSELWLRVAGATGGMSELSPRATIVFLSLYRRLRHCLEAGIENKSALMEGFL